jgi:hypothetical protein
MDPTMREWLARLGRTIGCVLVVVADLVLAGLGIWYLLTR